MSKNLYIDGDIILYRSCLNAERDVRFDGDIHVLFSNFADAKNNFLDQVNDLEASYDRTIEGGGQLVIALSDDNNWRKSYDSSYKSNRIDVRKPLALAELKAWVADTYFTVSYTNMEADDVLGITATKHNAIIWSPDKDLMQIPGLHMISGKLHNVTPEAGKYWHYYQTLVGDTADGYKGCPGIGAVKAEKMLRKSNTWATVLDAYLKAGLTEADALKQARLARILQKSDVDSEFNILMWTPPVNEEDKPYV